MRADIVFVSQELAELSLALIDYMVELYEALCEAEAYDEADHVSHTLVDHGISLTHGPHGVTWEKT